MEYLILGLLALVAAAVAFLYWQTCKVRDDFKQQLENTREELKTSRLELTLAREESTEQFARLFKSNNAQLEWLKSHSELNETLERNKREAQERHAVAIQKLEASTGLLDRLTHIKDIAEMQQQGAIATERLTELLKSSESVATRAHALEALSRVNQREFARILTSVALEDPDEGVLCYAALMAGRLNISEAIAKLHEVEFNAGEPRPNTPKRPAVQRTCAWALRRLGKPDQYQRLNGESDQVFAYILANAPLAMRDGRFKQLRESCKWNERFQSGAISGAVIQGDYDLILKVAARNHQELSDLILYDLQSVPWIHSTHTMQVVNRSRHTHWIRKSVLIDKTRKNKPAWIFLKVASGMTEAIVLTVKEIQEVDEAAAVFGDKEVVVRLTPNDEEDFTRQLRKLTDLPYVLQSQSLRPLLWFDRHLQAASLFSDLTVP